MTKDGIRTEENTSLRPLEKDEGKLVKWHSITKVENAKFVAATVVLRLWNSITLTIVGKISEFQIKDTQEVGVESWRKSKNAFSFVLIVTEKFTLDCSFHEKSWLKNRVKSGKPAFRTSRKMVILSQAMTEHAQSWKVQRLERKLVP